MKIPEEVFANPQLGDTIQGKYLGYRGYSSYARFAWVACLFCGQPHWVRNTVREKTRPHCSKCSPRHQTRSIQQYTPEVLNKYHPDATGEYKTIRVSNTPQEGDLIRGGEIGRNNLSLFRWTRCPRCGICRWIFKGTRGDPMCPKCGNEYKREKYIGEKSSQWKGGRIISRYGYIYVRVRPTDPYFPMANYIGYVAEHRLIMAQQLGRCLERWEIVHHKHTKFPAGSRENKQDNRLNNLELIPTRFAHNTITILEGQILELRKKVATLETKVKLCDTLFRRDK